MDGTYPLPEAQLDRFFLKLQVTYPSFDELSDIVDRTTQRQEVRVEPMVTAADILEAQQLIRDVPIATHVKNYAIRLALATHPQESLASEPIRKYVRYGSSPRGAQSLVLAAKVRALFEGRFNVSFDDIRAVAVSCLRHRLILNFEGEAEGIDSATLIQQLTTSLSEHP
jgi:MoxR-like ATPase